MTMCIIRTPQKGICYLNLFLVIKETAYYDKNRQQRHCIILTEQFQVTAIYIFF